MKKKLASGTAYLIIAQFLAVLANYSINIGIGRILGSEIYGIFGVLMSLYLLNTSFLNTGIPRSVSKFIAESKNGLKNIFVKSFRLQLYSLKKLKQDIKLGFPLALNYVVDTIVAIGDRYVIAFFLGATAVGYYNPAYIVGSLIILFAKVPGVVLPALMAKLVDKGEEDKAKKMINYSIKGYLLLAIPFVVGCIVFSRPILSAYTNVDIANKSYLIVPIIALGSLFYGLNIILSNVLFVKMQTVLMFRTNALVAIINLVLNVVFLYYFKDIVVAAITTLVSYVVAFLYIMPKVNRQWAINFEMKVIIKSIIASLLMGAVMLWYVLIFNESINDISIILPGFLLGLAVYGVIIFVFSIFSKSELRLLRSIFL